MAAVHELLTPSQPKTASNNVTVYQCFYLFFFPIGFPVSISLAVTWNMEKRSA